MNAYAFWAAAINGEKPRMVVDQPELGFYRKGVYERNEKGNNKRVGWTPVIIFMSEGVMVARIGSEAHGRDVTGDELNELWSYCAANAITRGTYREVATLGKPWPDAHDPSKNSPTLEATFKPGDATPSHEASAKPTESPEQKLARDIAELSKGVSQYGKIDSDQMAGQVLSLKNELTTEAGRLDKMREALVRPHVDAQRAINDQWNPVIKQAKALCSTLLGKIAVWEDEKREAARIAQAAKDKLIAEHAAAALRAKANDEPPPPPIETPKANTPPPSTQVAAAVGRKASVKVARFVTGIDLDLAFKQFRNEPAVLGILMQLAQKAIDAGLTVEGATIEERSIVR